MELMPEFKLHRPETVAEAVKLNGGADTARYLAGGTDMVVNIRRGIETPEMLIDLTAVKEMTEIREDADGLHIGAAVRLSDLGASDVVQRDYTAIAEAARAVAGPTHQQYGTVGGNLCLDTRCMYYNQSEWWRSANAYCLKHRGEICHVAPGGKRCFAAFSGDVAPAALVHGGEIELVGPDGSRRIPLVDLYKNDGMDHLTLSPGELLVALHLPKATAGMASGYVKSRVRGSIDFPLAGAAVALTMKDGKIEALTIALTAVNPYPQLVKGCEGYIGKAVDGDLLEDIRENVRKQAKPMKTTTIAPWYRRRVVGALAQRIVARLAAG
ncbi:MAG: 4-hydroxybenzoyl-CoA reductase subunit beta [Rhodospirillaceae bacterium]|jgi:4-hydroxybenzoyl-CoA reductase subunit beta|nr:4-hydroxybenzoyl-CoA reductase subunit beta [Rhodospirillaceae bacterium]